MYNLQIPNAVYDWAQQIAHQSGQSVDEILMTYVHLVAEVVPVLPVNEEAELAALQYLSDDALWTIAYEQMPDTQQKRMQTLMDKNSAGKIDDLEYAELSTLVERGQQLMLRKSEAMALLTERGHTVSLKDSTGRD